MIKSFKHKGLEHFFKTGSTKGIQAIHSNKIRRILSALNVLDSLQPLSIYKLHPLKGEMQGAWAVTVQANWRITFEYNEKTNDVSIVDYQDYH